MSTDLFDKRQEYIDELDRLKTAKALLEKSILSVQGKITAIDREKYQ